MHGQTHIKFKENFVLRPQISLACKFVRN